LDDLKNVEFIWANELMKSQDYLKIVMQVARNSTVNPYHRPSTLL